MLTDEFNSEPECNFILLYHTHGYGHTGNILSSEGGIISLVIIIIFTAK